MSERCRTAPRPVLAGRAARLLARVAIAVIAVAAALAVTTGSAHAAAGNYKMTPQATDWGKCLDLGSNAPGTPVILYHCNPNIQSQEWWWNCSMPDRSCQVASASSGYVQCWDLRTYAQGSQLILNWCDSNLVSQHWDIDGYKIISIGSGKRFCLDERSYDDG